MYAISAAIAKLAPVLGTNKMLSCRISISSTAASPPYPLSVLNVSQSSRYTPFQSTICTLKGHSPDIHTETMSSPEPNFPHRTPIESRTYAAGIRPLRQLDITYQRLRQLDPSE